MLGAILSVLKKVLSVGAQSVPSIVAAYNPALGALVGTVLNAVVVTEGGGFGTALKGIDKRDAALVAATIAMPAIEKAFAAAGKPLRNQDLFSEGLAKLQEGIVDILNATGESNK